MSVLKGTGAALSPFRSGMWSPGVLSSKTMASKARNVPQCADDQGQTNTDWNRKQTSTRQLPRWCIYKSSGRHVVLAAISRRVVSARVTLLGAPCIRLVINTRRWSVVVILTSSRYQSLDNAWLHLICSVYKHSLVVTYSMCKHCLTVRCLWLWHTWCISSVYLSVVLDCDTLDV